MREPLQGLKRKEELEEGDSGSGSTGREVYFSYKDAMALDNRDDMLSPAELHRLIKVQGELHKNLVDKQKKTRLERLATKEGRKTQAPMQQQGFGLGGGQASSRKAHPISKKAQFSGIDPQVNSVPTNNKAETNAAEKDALTNRLENRLENRLQNVPKFNPTPRPY